MEDHFLLQQYHGEHLDEVVDVEADKEGPMYCASVGVGGEEGEEGRRGRKGGGGGREERGEGRKGGGGGREAARS